MIEIESGRGDNGEQRLRPRSHAGIYYVIHLRCLMCVIFVDDSALRIEAVTRLPILFRESAHIRIGPEMDDLSVLYFESPLSVDRSIEKFTAIQHRPRFVPDYLCLLSFRCGAIYFHHFTRLIERHQFITSHTCERLRLGVFARHLPIHFLESPVTGVPVIPPIYVAKNEFLNDMRINETSLEDSFSMLEATHPCEKSFRLFLNEHIRKLFGVLPVDVTKESCTGPLVFLTCDHLAGDHIPGVFLQLIPEIHHKVPYPPKSGHTAVYLNCCTYGCKVRSDESSFFSAAPILEASTPHLF